MRKGRISAARLGAWLAFLPFAVSAALTVALPLTITSGASPDWGYFQSLSLFVRSSVLHYRVLPIHDPWCAGGLNLLANPQTRLFSPMVLLDVALRPYLADLASLAIYAGFGMWGMYRVLQLRKIPNHAALLASFVFINATWFGGHFAEGHITLGTMQLLPFVLLCWMQIEKRGAQVALAALLAFFLLDGAVYTFFFSLLLIISGTAAGFKSLREIRDALIERPTFWLACIASSVLLAMPRIVPILADPPLLGAQFDTFEMPLKTLFLSFFWPLQKIDAITPGTPYGFWEFTCYLGIATFALVAVALFRNRELRRSTRGSILVCLFWLWVGGGWLHAINPWRLYQQVPLLNHTHVQSRLFLLMFIFYTVIAGHVFARLDFRAKRILLLVVLIIIEAVYCRNAPFELNMHLGKLQTTELIQSTTLTETVNFIGKPQLYYAKDKASKGCYEPGEPPAASVVASSDPGYRGEIWVEAGDGKASILSYIPGRLELEVSGSTESIVHINTRDLGYWSIETIGGGPAAATIVSLKNELLKLKVGPGNHVVKLRFRPNYLPWVAASWLVGGLGLLGLALSTYRPRTRPAGHSENAAAK